MPKLAQFGNRFLPIIAHFGRNSIPGEQQHTEDTAEMKSCLVCYMYTSCHLLWRASCMHSLIPRPPVLDHLQYAKILKVIKKNWWCRRPGNEPMQAVIAE